MPAKKGIPLTDAERAKRIRETARECGTDNDPTTFESAFAAVVSGEPDKRIQPKKRKPKTKTNNAKPQKETPEGPRAIGVLAITKRPF